MKELFLSLLHRAIARSLKSLLHLFLNPASECMPKRSALLLLKNHLTWCRVSKVGVVSGVMLIATFFINISIVSAQTVVAALDSIVCNSTNDIEAENCQMATITSLIKLYNVDAVLTLGNYKRPHGALSDSYNKALEDFKGIIYPTPSYVTKSTEDYYAYSGEVKSGLQKGYYSFDLGSWHFIALNPSCDDVKGCGTNSSQVRWLEQDLKNNQDRCTLAYWQNLSSSNGHSIATQQSIWKVLQDKKIDIILNGNGHDHTYKHLSFQRKANYLSSEQGFQVFIFGASGKLFDQLAQGNLLADANTSGVLFLTLYETSYVWWFEPVSGVQFRDIGATMCH